MEDKLLCPNCMEYTSYTIKEEEETYPVIGEDTTTISKVSYCNKCGKPVWNERLDTENLENFFNAYRKKHLSDIISPNDVTKAHLHFHWDLQAQRLKDGSYPDEVDVNLEDLMIALRVLGKYISMMEKDK